MFTGFELEDFEVFDIPSFAERMTGIRGKVRPKLQQLGKILTPQLMTRFHLEFFPHVAAHMRRRVNPPPETWVAFGPNKRGYKAYPHLAITIDHEGVNTRFILKSEAIDKKTLAHNLLKEEKKIQSFLKKQPLYWFEKGGVTPPVKIQERDIDFWKKIAQNLLNKKEYNFDIGFGLDKSDTKLKSKPFIDFVLAAFEKLHFFYLLG